MQIMPNLLYVLKQVHKKFHHSKRTKRRKSSSVIESVLSYPYVAEEPQRSLHEQRASFQQLVEVSSN